MIKYWKSIIYRLLSHQLIYAYATNSKMEKSLKSKLQERITHITSTIITYANNTELSKNIQFEKKEYLKNSFLVPEGEICENIFFIIKGSVRCFIYDNNLNDITTWFAFENQPIMSPVSYTLKLPTHERIQALENTSVWVVKQADLEIACQYDLNMNQVVRILTETTMARLVLRAFSLQSEFAEERYEDLITHQPDVLQRVPLRHIATYLGVKLETLSRIRRNFKQRQNIK